MLRAAIYARVSVAVVARLGRDDWELVTVDGTTWLFKRCKNLADSGEW